MSFRPIPEITAEQENFRLERHSSGFVMPHRDAVEPLPTGSYVAVIFKIVGYDRDVDGSLMARLEAVDHEGEETGWCEDHVGLYPGTGVVVDDPREFFDLQGQENEPGD